MQEDYIMNSVELDQQFIDEQSDSYMSDEEREYWIDLEESHEEEEEVLYEATEDEVVDNAFNSLFNVPKATSKSLRRAKKKTRRENAPKVSLWVGKWDELGHKWGAKVTRRTK